MSEKDHDRAAFNLADIRALRLLAIVCAIVFVALILIIPEPVQIAVAGGLMLLVMIASPLAIYWWRRRQARKDDKP
jgi:hypothetical protein